jgi:hypothetical protein
VEGDRLPRTRRPHALARGARVGRVDFPGGRQRAGRRVEDGDDECVRACPPGARSERGM